MRRTPALIVGGGPAGAAAAIMLARAQGEPELIERSAGPHPVVCGAFLGWDALDALRRLGIHVAALGAQPIDRLRLVMPGRIIEVPLPHRAAGLSRHCLDAALLAAATAEGAQINTGIAARAWQPEGRTLRLSNGNEIATDALFLATGKHDLRGLSRASPPHATIGLRCALSSTPLLAAALEGVIELHLFDSGYAGLLLQEDGIANLCLAIASDTAAMGIEPLIAALCERHPEFADRLQGGGGEWIAVAGVPYGWSASATPEGVFRIGDQGAVIASLAGDGIAIALNSGIAAARHLLQHGPASAPVFQNRFAATAARPLMLAEALRWAARHNLPRRALPASLIPLLARLTRVKPLG